MPDLLDGQPAKMEWYPSLLPLLKSFWPLIRLDRFPPDNEEKKKLMGEFFSTTAAPANAVAKTVALMKALQTENPDIKSWVAVGVRTNFIPLHTRAAD